MSTEALSQRPYEDDPDVVMLDTEPAESEYGVYKPGRRILGSMATSAAAGEFLRRTNSVLAAGARPAPEIPPHTDAEEWPEQAFPRAA